MLITQFVKVALKKSLRTNRGTSNGAGNISRTETDPLKVITAPGDGRHSPNN
jgi:hypothetical protein